MLKTVAAALLVLFGAAGAHASESAASVTPRATVSLVSDTNAPAPGKPYRLGLHFQLAKGWHIYGRNPGDAGIPPELTWQAPTGTTIGTIAWPAPQRVTEGPLVTHSYIGDVLLAVPATGPGPVQLQANWLICNNICVPEEARFTLDLPAGAGTPSAEALLFARQALPRPSPWPARIAPDGTLSLAGVPQGSVHAAWFVPDDVDVVRPSQAQTVRDTADGIALALAPGEAFKAGQTISGVLTLTDAAGQIEALSVTAEPGAAAATTALWEALLFALLGGLILNLMPCVFPILAMKAFAIARLAAENRRTARAHAAFYTFGVLASFAAIGLALLGLRAAGQSLGWGFQFQSPVFVAVMAWVLFAVGLNLSGVFGIETQFAGAGQGLVSRGGRTGSFFSGVLAVLVATPCTAPFMGVAITAALAAPPAATVAVFLAMGLGLAAPTALLTVIPAVARLLPRPGAWMDVLKQALAFPMYAAAAWLVWVASLQSGPEGVLACAAGLVLVGFAAWALRFGPRVGRGLAITATIAALALLPLVQQAQPPSATATTERYTPQHLADLRAAGRPVFVNMTAAWCVTCLVNERIALSPSPVRDAFAAAGVVYLKGDWTRQDPEITRFLREQGRDGVPLYVFFPSGGRAPVILPQILTQSAVLDALRG